MEKQNNEFSSLVFSPNSLTYYELIDATLSNLIDENYYNLPTGISYTLPKRVLGKFFTHYFLTHTDELIEYGDSPSKKAQHCYYDFINCNWLEEDPESPEDSIVVIIPNKTVIFISNFRFCKNRRNRLKKAQNKR